MASKKHQKNKTVSVAATHQKSTATVASTAYMPATGKPFYYAIAAVLFLPTLIAPLWTNYGYSPDLHMAYVIQTGVGILLSWFFFSHAKQKQLVLVHSPLLYTILAFYIWAFLSLIWAHNRYEGLIVLLDWGAGVLMFLLVLNHVRNSAQLAMLVQVVFAGALLLSLLGIMQYLFGVDWVPQHKLAKPAATFNNKNMAGQYCLMGFALGVGLWLRAKEIRYIWFFAIANSLIAVFLFYTNSRGTLISFLIVLAFLLLFFLSEKIFNRKKEGQGAVVSSSTLLKTKTLAIAGAVFLYLFMIAWGPKGIVGFDKTSKRVDRIATVFSKELNVNIEKTGKSRLNIWSNSFEMIKDHPITGVGVGNWMVFYPYYQTAAKIDYETRSKIEHINAHNDYIEITSDLGLVGLVLLLSILFTTVVLAFRCLYLYRENENRYILLGAFLALTGISVNALGSFPLHQPAPILVVFFLFGVFANEYARWQKSKVWVIQAKLLPVIAGLVSVFATATVFAMHYQLNESEVNVRRSTLAFERKSFHDMMRYGRSANEHFPIRTLPLNYTGLGYVYTGRCGQAIKVFEKVKADYPHRNSTLESLGHCHVTLANQNRIQGKFDLFQEHTKKAEEVFLHYAKIRRDSGYARFNLGMVYKMQSELLTGAEKQQKIGSAIDQLDQAIQLQESAKLTKHDRKIDLILTRKTIEELKEQF